MLRRAWNERAYLDDESETDELELVEAKAFKGWEGGFRFVWVAPDASGGTREIQVASLLVAAVREFQLGGKLATPEVCQYFLEGGCRFGADCRNMHLCKWFGKGPCPNGFLCKFAHWK